MNPEKPENKPEEKNLKFEDLIQFLVDNPGDSRRILGFFLEKEAVGNFAKLRREHVERILKRMGYKNIDPDIFKENIDDTESLFLKAPKFIPKE